MHWKRVNSRICGRKKRQVVDVIIDENCSPVYGLVFLFKWRPGDEPIGTPADEEAGIFFAQQVIPNACATQALVNMLLNVDEPEVKLGSMLNDYKEFAKDFDPGVSSFLLSNQTPHPLPSLQNRGLTLSNMEQMRAVHNSFGRQTLFELDLKGPKDDDNYHFITYVPKNGKVYELDGLRDTPLEVAVVKEGQDWLQAVKPVIQARIEKWREFLQKIQEITPFRYNDGEIHFNLMAVIGDRRAKYLKRMTELNDLGVDSPEAAAEICNLQTLIDEEEEKMKKLVIYSFTRENAANKDIVNARNCVRTLIFIYNFCDVKEGSNKFGIWVYCALFNYEISVISSRSELVYLENMNQVCE